MKHNLARSSMLCLSMVSLSLCVTLKSEAQSVKRQSIASSGSSALTDGVSVQQTIGQPYSTAGYYDKETSIHPGFQQFSVFHLEPILSTYLNLGVYPNPAAYAVTLESPDIIKDAFIQVTDINGKLLLSEKVAEMKTYSIHCEAWQNGSYFISLYDTQNNKYSSKLIITK